MRRFIAGVDIGNATTETALGEIDEGKTIINCSSGIAKTTGIKGTIENVTGVIDSIENACAKLGIEIQELKEIRINEAAPVIGDFAMETITQTVITESTLIGHNPDTPGGKGIGVGYTVKIEKLDKITPEKNAIIVVNKKYDFMDVASKVNAAIRKGNTVSGLILQKDDGVLVSNRLERKIPILDEVEMCEKIPEGVLCAVEVAEEGHSIDLLSNPYGIATVFNLSQEETRHVVQIAKALIGTRSAVVMKTPGGGIRERTIPAGSITVKGVKNSLTVDVDAGAEKIMDAVKKVWPVKNIYGDSGTNVGGMIAGVKKKMASIIGKKEDEIYIQDLYAVDTMVSQNVTGGIANEFFMEKSVGIATMVKTERFHMKVIADAIEKKTGCRTVIGGVEGYMATDGALTTPGAGKPVVIVDIGAGSTDACYDNGKERRITHLAGAGNMATSLIQSELGLESFEEAENVKKYPLAKVESLFHIRYENGGVRFFSEPLKSHLFAKTVFLMPEHMEAVNTKHSMERISHVRRKVKEKVLVNNVMRALEEVSEKKEINEFENVILVGGTALDFELSNMLTKRLAIHKIIAGKGNIRGCEGPRNAVATGLLYSFLNERKM